MRTVEINIEGHGYIILDGNLAYTETNDGSLLVKAVEDLTEDNIFKTKRKAEKFAKSAGVNDLDIHYVSLKRSIAHEKAS